MSAVTPFDAMFFFGADNVEEVNTEFARWMQSPYPRMLPDLSDWVKVIAVEYMIGHGDYVWFVRNGEVQRRESWQVREIPVG